MQTLKELKNDSLKLAELAQEIRAGVDSEQKHINEVESDKSRSKAWILEKVAELKASTRPALAALWGELNARYAEMKATEPFYTIPMLAFSREPLLYASCDPTGNASDRDGWAAKEAAARSNILQELALMPLPIAKIWAVYHAQRRDWGRTYLAALHLGDGLPFGLGGLPLPALETADEIFYLADVCLKESEIAMDELKGLRKGVSAIALGLMHAEHERRKLERQAQWSFNVDERKKLGLDETTLATLLEPAALNITLPDRQTGAGFELGAPVEG